MSSVENKTVEEVEKKYNFELNPGNAIFALDIGTRTVVGLVGTESDGVLHVIDVEIQEHRSRAMLDGQIHDIVKVSEVVRTVKNNLESRLGFELKNVAIAAAGRVLKTYSVKVDRRIDEGTVITTEMVSSLELEGVQQAHTKINEDNIIPDANSYYCVGHSVINYYLNGYIMSNLVSHKGNTISANVLATFLPHTVIDSLHSVVENVGLKVTSLTLEPIAAINVAIPQDIRLLNIALVDIGAGTSDIAITRDGAVVAYAMCPDAGDEITEKIAKHYLLDFNTAERVKIEVQTNNEVEFEDIMGFKHTTNAEEVVHVIKGAVDNLAEIIADKIIKCNGKSPNAVICIGGGSQTPGLMKKLAEKLELPMERVGLRGREIIKNVEFLTEKLVGPDAITPIGIAATAIMKRGHDFINVRINDVRVTLFNTQHLTVGDAVASYGFVPKDFIPKRGKALSFELNNETYTKKGEHGKPSEIWVNNQAAHLETPIGNGDEITVIPAQDGEDAKASIKDFVSDVRVKKILFDGKEYEITTKACINGVEVRFNQEIFEGDKVSITEITTLGEFAKSEGINIVNLQLVVGDKLIDKNYILKSEDDILVLEGGSDEEVAASAEDVAADDLDAENEDVYEGIMVKVNNRTVNLKGKNQYLLVDVFRYLEVDLSKSSGQISLIINGHTANFTSTIKDGDSIQISW